MKRFVRRLCGVLLLIAGLLLPARAEKRISVAQLDQIVSELKSAPDTEAAQRLSDLQLTERLSSDRLSTYSQVLSGEKSRQALRAVADQSQFLDPPAYEIPANPAPSFAEQRRMMGLVAN